MHKLLSNVLRLPSNKHKLWKAKFPQWSKQMHIWKKSGNPYVMILVLCVEAQSGEVVVVPSKLFWGLWAFSILCTEWLPIWTIEINIIGVDLKLWELYCYNVRLLSHFATIKSFCVDKLTLFPYILWWTIRHDYNWNSENKHRHNKLMWWRNFGHYYVLSILTKNILLGKVLPL